MTYDKAWHAFLIILMLGDQFGVHLQHVAIFVIT